MVDCNKKFVSVGGVKKMGLVALSNDWVRLFPGSNQFQLTGISNATIKYTICK